MLPSTGYFKAINCPFYESGTCDRPYCHFKHSKREDAGTTVETNETQESRSAGQIQESKTSAVTVVSQVAEGLKPSLSSGSSGALETVTTNAVEEGRIDVSALISKSVPCVYNPTPISELKKRHIPIVSYMPTRDSKAAVKRKCSPDGIKPWLSVACESADSQAAEVKYKPTAITNPESRDSGQSYVPTCMSDTSSSDSYNDSNSNEYLLKLREAYYPRCKKRREEYVPKKVKTPLKTVEGLGDATLDQREPKFDAQSSENQGRASFDEEPKFSDDDDDDVRESVGESEDNVRNRINDRIKSDVVAEENISRRDIKEITDCWSNAQCAYAPVLETGDENQSVDAEATNRANATKSNDSNTAREHKTVERSRGRDRKGSSHSCSHKKEKHDPDEKLRSTSHSKGKSRSRSRHDSADSKRRKHEKDKPRDKDREMCRDKGKSKDKERGRHKSKERKKQRYDESERRRECNSKKASAEGSKKKEGEEEVVAKKGCDEGRKRSRRSDRKSLEKGIEKSRAPRKNSEERNWTDGLNFNEDADEDNDDCDIVDNDVDIDDVMLLSASDSEHDVQEECLKIFQEYQVPERSIAVTSEEEKSVSSMEKAVNEEIGRRRVAHPSAAACVVRQTANQNQQSRKQFINPQQKMYERWRLMRDATAEKAMGCSVSKDVQRNQVDTAIGTACNNELKVNGNGRVRIAHVPYAKSLAMEKRKVTENIPKTVEAKAADNCKTAAQTSKSGVRIAHVPQLVPQLIRPEPLQGTTHKFAVNVRQYYVNMMHDVCVQIYTNAEDSAQRAIKEEYACHERCKALNVYKSSCMLAIHRLRKEVDQNSSAESGAAMITPGSSMVSHEAVLTGKSRGTWSVLKSKKSVTEFRGPMLYSMLKKWILTEQQLRDNGFPRPHPDGQKGRAKVYVINSRNQGVLSKVANERICSRCGQAYTVDKQGLAVRPQNCIYHWGKKFTIRGEGKYSCCQQYGSATGCCDAKAHVWDYIDYENLRGYVKTLPKDIPIEEQAVYALDCEMCYTSQGTELTRITVIDEDCNVTYETLVKPQNPIIDYNTRFSGITEESMKDVTTTLLDVQATLLTMFSDKTILVGHSLESDFKALKLIHDTVVDTSVLFPHKRGYPQKRALRNLCSEYLRKIIQNDVNGHDSKEDAIACMELILWKVKEEAKLQ